MSQRYWQRGSCPAPLSDNRLLNQTGGRGWGRLHLHAHAASLIKELSKELGLNGYDGILFCALARVITVVLACAVLWSEVFVVWLLVIGVLVFMVVWGISVLRFWL